MPVELALYQPDIPQNAGTLLRLGACLGVRVHVIHPTGFLFSSAALKRAALDYLARSDYLEHDSFARFQQWRRAAGKRLVLLTTRGQISAYAAAYRETDLLMVGRESAGVPDEVAAAADLRVRIPMAEGLRSLNVAVAAAMAIGEALRQTGAFGRLE
jgi:tRNA (cytidine/uridine-2'-O-)-methyltransferase